MRWRRAYWGWDQRLKPWECRKGSIDVEFVGSALHLSVEVAPSRVVSACHTYIKNIIRDLAHSAAVHR